MPSNRTEFEYPRRVSDTSGIPGLGFDQEGFYLRPVIDVLDRRTDNAQKAYLLD
jgi:hypothetical protein